MVKALVGVLAVMTIASCNSDPNRCRFDGESCSASQSCCDPSATCANGTCKVPACASANQACGVSGCCSGYACNTVGVCEVSGCKALGAECGTFPGNMCCGTASCTGPKSAAGYNTCVSGSSCGSSGQACTSPTSCCSGLTCSRFSNKCETGQIGDPCSSNAQCTAGGLLCYSGFTGNNGNISNGGWCSFACSSDVECGSTNACALDSLNHQRCFPICNDNSDCTIYGSGLTCQSVTTVSNLNLQVCSG